MTKADIVAEISQKTGFDRNQVQDTVESFFAVVKDSMEQGENIYVRGFGSFVNKKRARKVARNIAKQTSIEIPEHYVPSFKPSKNFVERIRSSKKVVAANESH